MIRARYYLLAFGDLLMCGVALGLMIMVRFGTHWNSELVMKHASAFSLVFPIWLVIFFIFNLYTIRLINPNPRTIGQMALAIATAVVVSVLIFYIHPAFGILPKENLLIVGIFAFITVTAWRRFFYALTASAFVRSIALVGDSVEMEDLKHEIRANPYIGKIVLHTKDVDSLVSSSLSRKIDLVILASSTPEAASILFQRFNASTQTLVDAYQELLAKIPLSLVTEETTVSLLTQKESPAAAIATRIMEITISLIVLIVTSPFLAVAAIAKKIEDGGQVILYPHVRVGKNGKEFQFYKIRSMVMDAEKTGVQWTTEHDPRITPIGRVIRKLHIDELPQFWNIVKGYMALVGPRPERPQFVKKLEEDIPYYTLRHVIKPGFTGWAQIKFRYARTVLDSRKKFEYDLYYLVHRNLLLDLGIMLKTIQIVFTH